MAELLSDEREELGSAYPAGMTQRLAPGRLRFLGAAAISLGIQGPTGGILFLPALMAGIVGGQGPFAFLIATAAMLPVAFVFSRFSRYYASAGSAYAFAGRAVHPVFGFATCFLLLFTYLTYTSANYAGASNIAESLLKEQGVTGIPWGVVAAVFFVLTGLAAYRTIHFSSAVILLLEGASLLVVFAVGIVVIAKGGLGGHAVRLSPLQPHGLGFQTAVLGLVFAYTGFSGFEGAATVGEETRLPRRSIPAAIFATLLLGGLSYTFGSYVETIGLSGKALTGSTAPLADVAHTYVSPWVATAILVAAVVSSFGAILACINAAARLLYALGRDGFVSERLASVSPRYRSPGVAVVVVMVLTGIGALALAKYEPLELFFYQATVGADVILVVYLFTCLAGLVFAVRRRAAGMGVGSVLGLAVLALVVRYTVYPVPEYPFDRLLLVAAGAVVLSLALPLLLPGLRRRVTASPLFTATPSGAYPESRPPSRKVRV